MKIIKINDKPADFLAKVSNLTISVHGCTYKISSDHLGLKIYREDEWNDVISIFPKSTKEVVIK